MSTPLRAFCLTVDQRRSRRSADAVPGAERALASLPDLLLAPERTAGDELQAVVASPRSVVEAVRRLVRQGDWHVGIGVGAVDEPLPVSTRAARGPAFLHARSAVSRAPSTAADLAVQASESSPPRGVGAAPYRGDVPPTPPAADGPAHAALAEAALAALVGVWRRRSPEGWEVVDLVETGLTGRDAAARLGISPSAVSQRLRAADHAVEPGLTALATHHLAHALAGGIR